MIDCSTKISSSLGFPASAQSLAALATVARQEFGVAALWSIPTLADPVDDARNVGRALAKHGGVKGLLMAAKIEHALAAAGAPSWR